MTMPDMKVETAMTTLPNIHPGEVLREEFLVPLGITAYRLSKDISVPQTRISEILAERRSITADTALRLGHYFNTSSKFWMNLQTAFDLEDAETEKAEEIRSLPVCSYSADVISVSGTSSPP